MIHTLLPLQSSLGLITLVATSMEYGVCRVWWPSKSEDCPHKALKERPATGLRRRQRSLEARAQGRRRRPSSPAVPRDSDETLRQSLVLSDDVSRRSGPVLGLRLCWHCIPDVFLICNSSLLYCSNSVTLKLLYTDVPSSRHKGLALLVL